jgi:hypothetical protein
VSVSEYRSHGHLLVKLGQSLHEGLPFAHVAHSKVIKKTFYYTLKRAPLFKIPHGGCLLADPTNWTPLYT